MCFDKSMNIIRWKIWANKYIKPFYIGFNEHIISNNDTFIKTKNCFFNIILQNVKLHM